MSPAKKGSAFTNSTNAAAREIRMRREGLSQRVGVKIAGRGRTDKRTFAVPVVIPACVIGQLMSDIDAQVRHGLLVLVLQRAQRLQTVKLARCRQRW
jgi:hypothetical protein